MKKYLPLILLVVLAIIILVMLTRAPARKQISSDFQRTYGSVTVSLDTIFSMPYVIDILAAWKTGIVYHTMKDKKIGLIDTAGHIMQVVDFKPVSLLSSVHSISVLPDQVHFIDLNGLCTQVTGFMSATTVFRDSLPAGTQGAVVNDDHGYTFMQYNAVTNQTTLRESKDGSRNSITLFTFKQLYDQGVSYFGQLIKNTTGSSAFYIPFYNSQCIVYNYGMKKVAFIQTIDKTPIANVGVPVPGGEMLSSKASVINRKGTANAKWLFILSYARGAGDSASSELLDVYDIASTRYLTSIYLPVLKKNMVRAMTCMENKLIFSSGKKVIIYSIHEKNKRN